tara:strand:+ start:577 stop:900 length:324 start_codon:yes stop_codon:yes gene_type:complete
MNVTFAQMARCFAAYGDLDSAFWPFVKHVWTSLDDPNLDYDDIHNDPVASAEAMRRMLAITMADVYRMVMIDTHYPDAPLVEQLRAGSSFRADFLRKADVDIDLQVT